MSVLLTSGCASTGGWARSDARTCEPDAAPRVCIEADPDYGHVLVLADVELLPGECVTANLESHGGGLRIVTRDPRNQRFHDWVMVRRGWVTHLVIDKQGRVTADSDRCTDRP